MPQIPVRTCTPVFAGVRLISLRMPHQVTLAGYEIKRKGLLRGAVHVGLDATPLVGTAKGIVEIFTGDLIPDRELKRSDR